ncbi:protein translocase subunit [Blastocladiella emersonii ATCC 22665]|nr:protein translocase subunit [Blastocladiella emersonii ATCC 22665]
MIRRSVANYARAELRRRTAAAAATSLAPPPSCAHATQRRYASGSAGRDDGGNAGPNMGPGRAFIEGFVTSIRRQVQENKELKDNVKLLADEATRLSESDSIKKAKELAEGGTSATSEALKKTGAVVGKVAETVSETVTKVAETPVGKAATTTIKKTTQAVGQAAEAAVRPITSSEQYKQASEDLAKAIHQASSRYGGVTSKHYRSLIKRQRELDYEMRAKITENTEAMGVVLRPDSKWKRSWDDFKESSPLARNMFSLQRKVAESDNLVVSWGRFFVESFQDRFGGLFEETETAKAMSLLKGLDPTFNQEAFLREAREFILPEVLEAWLAGDRETLTRWCSEASVRVLTAGHDELVKQGMVSDSRLVELKGVELVSAKVLENNIPVLMVSCTTQEVILYRDKVSKEVRLGKEDVIMRCSYVVVLTVEEGNDDPITRGWKVVDQAKVAGGSMV